MKLLLHLHVATVAITVSYITLYLANQDAAETWCVSYAVVIFALTLQALLTERRIAHARTQNRPGHPRRA